MPLPSGELLPTASVPLCKVVPPLYVLLWVSTMLLEHAYINPLHSFPTRRSSDLVVRPVLDRVKVRVPVRVTAPLKVTSKLPPMVTFPASVTGLGREIGRAHV